MYMIYKYFIIFIGQNKSVYPSVCLFVHPEMRVVWATGQPLSSLVSSNSQVNAVYMISWINFNP